MKTSILAVLLFFAFSISAKAKSRTDKSDTTISKVTKTERDGSSYQKAIIIFEKQEGIGERAEYSWIKNKYPGYKTDNQELIFHDKIPYDIINIITADGQKVAVYFDISNFYGKL